MSDFMKMDIFFVVTTVVTIVIGVFVCVALFYGIRLVRTLDRISNEIEEEAKSFRADIQEARQNMQREGMKLSALFDFFGKSTKRVAGRKKKG